MDYQKKYLKYKKKYLAAKKIYGGIDHDIELLQAHKYFDGSGPLNSQGIKLLDDWAQEKNESEKMGEVMQQVVWWCRGRYKGLKLPLTSMVDWTYGKGLEPEKKEKVIQAIRIYHFFGETINKLTETRKGAPLEEKVKDEDEYAALMRVLGEAFYRDPNRMLLECSRKFDALNVELPNNIDVEKLPQDFYLALEKISEDTMEEFKNSRFMSDPVITEFSNNPVKLGEILKKFPELSKKVEEKFDELLEKEKEEVSYDLLAQLFPKKYKLEATELDLELKKMSDLGVDYKKEMPLRDQNYQPTIEGGWIPAAILIGLGLLYGVIYCVAYAVGSVYESIFPKPPSLVDVGHAEHMLLKMSIDNIYRLLNVPRDKSDPDWWGTEPWPTALWWALDISEQKKYKIQDSKIKDEKILEREGVNYKPDDNEVLLEFKKRLGLKTEVYPDPPTTPDQTTTPEDHTLTLQQIINKNNWNHKIEAHLEKIEHKPSWPW